MRACGIASKVRDQCRTHLEEALLAKPVFMSVACYQREQCLVDGRCLQWKELRTGRESTCSEHVR